MKARHLWKNKRSHVAVLYHVIQSQSQPQRQSCAAVWSRARTWRERKSQHERRSKQGWWRRERDKPHHCSHPHKRFIFCGAEFFLFPRRRRQSKRCHLRAVFCRDISAAEWSKVKVRSHRTRWTRCGASSLHVKSMEIENMTSSITLKDDTKWNMRKTTGENPSYSTLPHYNKVTQCISNPSNSRR